MHSMFARVALAALSIAGSSLIFAQPVESLRDDEGRPALLGTPAVRMVTLAPSLTELVFAAGAGDKLVGLSAYSDYPAEARRLPQVADAAGISWESLLALKPDLVLAWKGGTRPADIARLNRLGVNVFVIEIKQLADVSRALRSIGRLVGRPGPADWAADSFQRELDTLRDANAGKPAVKLFVEISSRPLMTVNRDHVISEMIRLCGGANVFEDMTSLVSEPSREELLARAPDAILFGKSSNEKRFANAPVYAGLAPVRDGNVYGVTADYAFRPGPRLLMAAREICDALDLSRAKLKAGAKAAR
jgi:iron complex transport system substrate-binding protein